MLDSTHCRWLDGKPCDGGGALEPQGVRLEGWSWHSMADMVPIGLARGMPAEGSNQSAGGGRRVRLGLRPLSAASYSQSVVGLVLRGGWTGPTLLPLPLLGKELQPRPTRIHTCGVPRRCLRPLCQTSIIIHT